MMKKRTILLIAAAGLVLLVIAVFAVQHKGDRDEGSIETVLVKQGKFVAKIVEVGEMQALNAKSISGPFWGRIGQLVPEGTVVQPGDTVLWMETGEIEDEIEEEEGNFELAKSRLDRQKERMYLTRFQKEMAVKTAQVRLEYAEIDLEDVRDRLQKEAQLFENKMASKASVEAARLRVSAAELALTNAQMDLEKAQRDQTSSLKVQEESLKQAQIELEKARERLSEEKRWMERAVVRVEEPGMIVYVLGWAGSGMTKPQAGDQVWRGKRLMEIPDLSEMTVVMQVNEMDISRVAVGQRALVRVDAFPEMRLNGKIVHVGALDKDTGQSGPSRKSQVEGINVFAVTVLIDKEDLKGQQMTPATLDTTVQEVDVERPPIIRQGMTASVDVIVEEVAAAVFVPLRAVFERDGAYLVYTMEDGIPKERKVVLGPSNESDVIIRENLKVGEQVCLGNFGELIRNEQ